MTQHLTEDAIRALLEEQARARLHRSLNAAERREVRDLAARIAQATPSASVPTRPARRRWQWPAASRARCFLGVLCALAGAGYATQADFMLWPVLRIPMAIITWVLMVLLVLGLVRAGMPFLPIVYIPIFAVAGWALLFASDSYLTKTWSSGLFEGSSVLDWLALAFWVAACLLFWSGRPTREAS